MYNSSTRCTILKGIYYTLSKNHNKKKADIKGDIYIPYVRFPKRMQQNYKKRVSKLKKCTKQVDAPKNA